VISCVAAHDAEFSVENVLSVTSVNDSIVHNKLDHDRLGIVTMEAQILSVAGDDITVLPESLLNTGFAIGAVMLDETTRTNVLAVVLTGLHYWVAPFKRTTWGLFVQELDGLFDCILTFFSSECHLGITLEEIAIKLSEHVFEQRHIRLGILSYIVVLFEDILVNLFHTGSWNVRGIGHFEFKLL